MYREKTALRIRGSIAFLAFFLVIFFTSTNKADGQDPSIRLKVVAEQANIRLEPDISSIIIRQVSQGTILNATEKKQEWYAVLLTSRQGAEVTGYVHESLVTVIEPLVEEKRPVTKPQTKQKTRPVIPEEARQISPFNFSLAISGGGNTIQGGDLNGGIKGLADLYGDILAVQGKGSIDPVHLGYVLGFEVYFPISKMLSWGIGVEHFQAKNKSQVDYLQGTSNSVLLISPALRATPIGVILVFNPIPSLYIKGGIAYYFAQYSYAYIFQTADLIRQWEGKSSARGLGLSGGLGFLKKLSSHLIFFTEITGRYAKIKGFEGTENFQDSSSDTLREDGTLYLIQTQILEERTHPVLFIRDSRPNEAGIIGASEAQFNFSGISLKIGLRINF